MRKLTRLTGLFLALVMVFAFPLSVRADETDTAAPEKVGVFEDVEEGKYYSEAVRWASETKITTGTDSTHFKPSKACSRGQVITFLWRASGCPEPTITESKFTDLKGKEDKYYYKAILWAEETGLTYQMTQGNVFYPGDPCTRVTAITFLYRFCGSPEVPWIDGDNPFKDVDNPETFYYFPILWAKNNNITTGVDPTHFGVNRFCSRGQMVTFLYRAIGQK